MTGVEPGWHLVVSDLDGCLLDEHYGFDAARPALDALARRGWPLVLCSGKTQAEIEPLAQALALATPFIAENGGVIVFPPGAWAGPIPGASCLDDGSARLALGAPRSTLVVALREIAAEAGVRVRGFQDLDVSEISALTGLSEAAARLALAREFDEPFMVAKPEDVERLAQIAGRRGLTVAHGGRFHHLQASDKGLAVRTLRSLYALAGRVGPCLGLGDAQTDLPLLRAVDRPIVVPQADGRIAAVFTRELPASERAPEPGPAGWNAALLTVLAGARLPSVAGGN